MRKFNRIARRLLVANKVKGTIRVFNDSDNDYKDIPNASMCMTYTGYEWKPNHDYCKKIIRDSIYREFDVPEYTPAELADKIYGDLINDPMPLSNLDADLDLLVLEYRGDKDNYMKCTIKYDIYKIKNALKDRNVVLERKTNVSSLVEKYFKGKQLNEDETKVHIEDYLNSYYVDSQEIIIDIDNQDLCFQLWEAAEEYNKERKTENIQKNMFDNLMNDPSAMENAGKLRSRLKK